MYTERALLILLLSSSAVTALAHGGGLDKYGCHTNRKTGEYHCHRAPAVLPDRSDSIATAPNAPRASPPVAPAEKVITRSPAKPDPYLEYARIADPTKRLTCFDNPYLACIGVTNPNERLACFDRQTGK